MRPRTSPLAVRPTARTLLLVVSLASSLTACSMVGQDPVGGTDTSGPSASAEPSTEQSPEPSPEPSLIGTYDEGYELGYTHGSGTGAKATPAFLTERTAEFRRGYDAGYTTGKDEADSAATNPVTSFGSTMEWEDGLELTVTNDGPFTPSEWAAVGDYPTYLSFTFTVTNGTSTTWTSSGSTQISSGGVAGDEVYDSDQDYGGSPDGPVLPGQSISWQQGFGVNDPDDLTMSASVDWDHVEVIYTTVEDAWTF
ncbi:hypothetical protein [Cellulosimicrobium arenosum]|uniref:Uncharacterized protein n=1 Tax=Cellulosimicrobium arenosum TaxID=2708133 RepID=A0A927IZ20_9MICO|nr:hypothetical protein [Cellulosimicrobium arenosum]MBD8078175.1 hypothetical protein [Cellulosimicrobium arenosum]